MPYPVRNRHRGRRGLGLIMPADVPSRLRPWTDQADPSYPANNQAPTAADYLRSKATQAETMFKSFGGRSAANPTAPVYEVTAPPWIQPPPGYEVFFQPGIVNTPNNNSTDTTIFTLFNQAVPPGWDGVIGSIANFYTGPGFQSGAGLLIWRITRNGQPIKSFDNIQVAFGTFTQQGGIQPLLLPNPIRVFSGDVIKYVVNHAAASNLPVNGTQIITLLGGYIYPKPTV